MLASLPRCAASIRFLFVRPAFCLGLPSDSQSLTTPLPLANTSPCRVCRGLSPPSHQRGHHSQAGCAYAQRAMPGAQAKNRLQYGAGRITKTSQRSSQLNELASTQGESGDEATIYHQRMPSDIARLVRGQEQHCSSDLIRSAFATSRNRLLVSLRICRTYTTIHKMSCFRQNRSRVAANVGGDHTWAYRIEGDAGLRVGCCHLPG
ncbi:hypothetical protein PS862_01146 [Pseudomonas fluorescens]|uniref:Uncharacterized protein n=1 Tax=Pseudomonas fluorescens TaxID=294 RepID=A0A5E7HSP9_PSEFL|nr:hypothetical protein PS862_01146 [Pseudomonas fluorescens]